MLTQLQTPIPLLTSKGKAWAIAIIDYGPQWDLLWVTFVNATGECWTFNNKDIRQEENFTFGLKYSQFNNFDHRNGAGHNGKGDFPNGLNGSNKTNQHDSEKV